ncbi:hypothetical protein GJ496_001853 [Pomphorhynchus laevis]|nr:hypothetical protein GJ496_001853 [Pomphorhynchus laevis]
MMTAFLLLTGIIAFQISEQSSPNRHFQIVKPSQKCTDENEAKYWLSKDSECTICSCTDAGSFSCSSIECLMDLKCPEGQELVSDGCCPYCKSIKEDNVKHYCVLPQTNDMVSQNSIITRSWCGLNMVCTGDGSYLSIYRSCFSSYVMWWCSTFVMMVIIFAICIWTMIRAYRNYYYFNNSVYLDDRQTYFEDYKHVDPQYTEEGTTEKPVEFV